jgi:hypothetical protein
VMRASVERCIFIELPHHADREPQFILMWLLLRSHSFQKRVEASGR